MSLIDDNETDGSSFIWTIQNFDCCFQKFGEELGSPIFVLNNDKWRIVIFPKGDNNPLFFGLELVRIEEKLQSQKRVYYTLSIRSITGSFKKNCDSSTMFSPNQKTFRFPEFLTLKELKKSYLENYMITLRCRIWKIDDELLANGQCHATTIVSAERTTKIWPLANIRKWISPHTIAAEEDSISSKKLSHDVDAVLWKNSDGTNGRIRVYVTRIGPKIPYFLTCELSVFASDSDEILHSLQNEYWIGTSELLQFKTVAFIPLSKIYKCKEPYLRCELSVSSDVAYSKIEIVKNGKAIKQQVEIGLGQQAGRCKQGNGKKYSNYREDDLRRLYVNGKFSDFTIRSSSREFPVHKAILSARSSVFCAMFQRDMTENRTGVVEIDDIEEDIIHRMLLFVYSDIVENLDRDVASRLYYAADKYEIVPLRRKCANFLKENVSISDCCELMVLANIHQDEDMELFVRDFILDHSAEVMGSAEWDKFMKEHLQLASKVMFTFCKRNLKI